MCTYQRDKFSRANTAPAGQRTATVEIERDRRAFLMISPVPLQLARLLAQLVVANGVGVKATRVRRDRQTPRDKSTIFRRAVVDSRYKT